MHCEILIRVSGCIGLNSPAGATSISDIRRILGQRGLVDAGAKAKAHCEVMAAATRATRVGDTRTIFSLDQRKNSIEPILKSKSIALLLGGGGGCFLPLLKAA